MPNDLFHERMRFDTMNFNQLEVRLQKITDRQKLENFIRISEERKYFSLFNRAIEKYKTLFKSFPSYIENFVRLYGLYGEAPAKYDIPKGSLGTSSGYKPPIVIPQSNISPSLKEKVIKYEKFGNPKKKSYPTKPVDIADVIYTKRKLRLE